MRTLNEQEILNSYVYSKARRFCQSQNGRKQRLLENVLLDLQFDGTTNVKIKCMAYFFWGLINFRA